MSSLFLPCSIGSIPVGRTMVANAHFCHYFRTVNGNRKFIEELTKWTFQEKSALDVVAVQHHKIGEEEAPAHYRIKDNMVRSCLFC